MRWSIWPNSNDLAGLSQIFGTAGSAIVLSGEAAQDRQHIAEFAAAAAEKYGVSIDPKHRGRAFLLIGNQSWPFPAPIVKRQTKWSFDAAAGRYRSCSGASARMSWMQSRSAGATVEAMEA